MLDQYKVVNLLAVFAGISLFILGARNMSYIENIPSLSELKKVQGVIEVYNCDGLVKYGDRLNFQYKNSKTNIDVNGVILNCSELTKNLKENNWSLIAWLDTSEYSPVAYAIQVGDYKLIADDIGVIKKQPNIIAILSILLGLYVVIHYSKKIILNKKSK